MPQMRDVFRREKEERRLIDERIRTEAMRTTDEEAGYILSILREVSSRYRDPIASASLIIPDSLKSSIQGTIHDLAQKLDVDYETQKRIERLSLATEITSMQQQTVM